MKLVLAIVQDEDVRRLMDGLTEGGFSFTRIASTGGFLRSGNTTLIIGVEDEKLEDVISIIEQKCKTRVSYCAGRRCEKTYGWFD